MATNSCPEVSYLDKPRQIWTRLDTRFARIFVWLLPPPAWRCGAAPHDRYDLIFGRHRGGVGAYAV